VKLSPRSCRQVCVWPDRAAEDACSAFGRTSTVSKSITNCNSVCKANAFSFYEGHTMDLVTFATRVCKLLGVETMIGTVTATRLFSKRPDSI
jgi:purine nucleoside phosphorylase